MQTGNSLDNIRIASPCPMNWERMMGDDRVRHCDECNLHVYNIAELTRAEAQTLIANTEGRLCVRIYRRADGTVITRDCPVGLRAIRHRLAMTAGAVLAAVMTLTTSIFGQKSGSKNMSSCRQQVMMTTEAAPAQNGLASVAGTLVDPNGAVIPGADIAITSDSTGKTVTTRTDVEGKFQINGLETGGYTLVLNSPGFKTAKIIDVKLKADEKFKLEVTMELSSSSVLTGVVAFSGPDLLIDSPPGKLIINDKIIQRLPIH